MWPRCHPNDSQTRYRQRTSCTLTPLSPASLSVVWTTGQAWYAELRARQRQTARAIRVCFARKASPWRASATAKCAPCLGLDKRDIFIGCQASETVVADPPARRTNRSSQPGLRLEPQSPGTHRCPYRHIWAIQLGAFSTKYVIEFHRQRLQRSRAVARQHLLWWCTPKADSRHTCCSRGPI
jgi:hypothetical protein